jgi:hypothetical protein
MVARAAGGVAPIVDARGFEARRKPRWTSLFDKWIEGRDAWAAALADELVPVLRAS